MEKKKEFKLIKCQLEGWTEVNQLLGDGWTLKSQSVPVVKGTSAHVLFSLVRTAEEKPVQSRIFIELESQQ